MYLFLLFKLQSPSKSPSKVYLMQYTYQDIFSTAPNSFLTHQFWCLLELLPFFCFSSSTSAKPFPWGLFFMWGKKKKCHSDEIRWIERVGLGGHAVFSQKLLNTQRRVGRCARKSPIMRWANALKESSKKVPWSQMEPLTTMPGGMMIQMGSRTLTQWGKPVLQAAHSPEDNSGFFVGPPSFKYNIRAHCCIRKCITPPPSNPCSPLVYGLGSLANFFF